MLIADKIRNKNFKMSSDAVGSGTLRPGVNSPFKYV